MSGDNDNADDDDDTSCHAVVMMESPASLQHGGNYGDGAGRGAGGGGADLVLGGVLLHNVAGNGEPQAALQGGLLLGPVGCGTRQGHVKAERQHHSILPCPRPQQSAHIMHRQLQLCEPSLKPHLLLWMIARAEGS